MYKIYTRINGVSKGYIHEILLIMRLTTIILLISLVQVSASTLGQRVTIKKQNSSLKIIFTEIRKQTGYIVLAQSDQMNKSKPVTVNLRDIPLEAAMAKILEGQDLSFSIEDKSIVIFHKADDQLKASQLAVDVKGKVIDINGAAIPGVTITVKGTKKSTATNNQGIFSIATSPNDILIFKMMGYASQEVAISPGSDIVITLVESATELSQIVVTALGIKREEKSLGYAVQKVEGSTLTTVKGVNVATSLTGKIAGLNIMNSTEFATNPTVYLRGDKALLVIDGIPYAKTSLDNIAPDDIESIDVLKGATASALYGNRGANGAIMVTTKKGRKDGELDISFNSSSMFSAGFLSFPKVQTSYSSGGGGKYGVGDYVWGDKLDIGRTAKQYNSSTYQFEDMPLVSKGKDNLSNFLQQGFLLNNNISITQSGKNGSLRASLSHVYNQGQYPNTKLNKVIASLSGEMRAGNFSLDGGFTFNKRFYPNNIGTGYGKGGYLYNLSIWSGTEYDIRDYKNYWVTGQENIQQNWMIHDWYDNPYFIANEILRGDNYGITNGYMNLSYKIKPWLKAVLRSGIDYYAEDTQWRNAISASGGWLKKGYYGITKENGFSSNNDLMLLADTKVGKLQINGLLGGSVYYYELANVLSETQNGITIPGFYSLAASTDAVKSTPKNQKKQVNSLYGKIGFAYDNFAYLDVTGRNDWSSTLAANDRSYFYPSVSGSLVFSELIKLPTWIEMAKLRASWTKTKLDPDIYAINNSYSITTNSWNGASKSSFPATIRGANILPQTNRSYEYGTAFSFLRNRIRFDATYFNTLYTDKIISSKVSLASGVEKVLINTKEQIERRGVELTLDGTVIKNNDFSWDIGVNWGTNKLYYADLDPIYSVDKSWVKKGANASWISGYLWETDPAGQPVLQNGLRVRSTKEAVIGNDQPDWIWGFNNTFRYKNLSLAFSFDGRRGGKTESTMVRYMWSSGTHIDSDNNWRYDEVVNKNKSFIADGVKVISGEIKRDVYGNIISDTRTFAPNDVATSYESYTKAYNGAEASTQNYFLQTFFKLRELSLNYTLPRKMIEKAGMKNASIGFVGQNMLLWTKEWKYSDPDIGTENLNSPSVRYMGFNVKVTF